MTTALLDALSKKSFEQITIADICQTADYPRSTFYKYYYDKLDLFSDYLHEHLFRYRSDISHEQKIKWVRRILSPMD